MKNTFLILLLLLLIGCDDSEVDRNNLPLETASCQKCKTEERHKVYVYKEHNQSGIICIFISKYPELAMRNAKMFIHDQKEKYKVILHTKTEPY